ncbi:LAGLIDADG family homing endonuclease [Alkalibacillus almallahensis]|uniref:LAGLIDADG family homing endonuclease n=1 Tax=Alkalibacillus almallahensis TaxID=1379154 RepID=UPI001422F16A|nr:LAGLIDADG family homing endonuclease [Alkalibacillus almallahensis]NIK12428.1 orotate phosphoribosyltransferase-like protein [Alkalibacillus almallahensis]
MQQWAISSEASSEMKMNVQRLLKLPKAQKYKYNKSNHVKEGDLMCAKEEVNHNVRRRPYGARDKEEIIKKVIQMHDKGVSQVEISKKLGVSRGTISRWNKEKAFINTRPPGLAGKLASKKYDYNENFFENIDHPNKAYLLGFILGDGTIVINRSSKKVVLTLAEQDKSLLYEIATCLNLNKNVKFRNKRNDREQNKYSLTIFSTKMANDLINLGVTPNKTGKEQWIDLNNPELQWHFLRGLFDADGHIRVYERVYIRKNGPKKYTKARFGITSNKPLLMDVLKFLKSYGIGQHVNGLYKSKGAMTCIYLAELTY